MDAEQVVSVLLSDASSNSARHTPGESLSVLICQHVLMRQIKLLFEQSQLVCCESLNSDGLAFHSRRWPIRVPVGMWSEEDTRIALCNTTHDDELLDPEEKALGDSPAAVSGPGWSHFFESPLKSPRSESDIIRYSPPHSPKYVPSFSQSPYSPRHSPLPVYSPASHIKLTPRIRDNPSPCKEGLPSSSTYRYLSTPFPPTYHPSSNSPTYHPSSTLLLLRYSALLLRHLRQEVRNAVKTKRSNAIMSPPTIKSPVYCGVFRFF